MLFWSHRDDWGVIRSAFARVSPEYHLQTPRLREPSVIGESRHITTVCEAKSSQSCPESSSWRFATMQGSNDSHCRSRPRGVARERTVNLVRMWMWFHWDGPHRVLQCGSGPVACPRVSDAKIGTLAVITDVTSVCLSSPNVFNPQLPQGLLSLVRGECLLLRARIGLQ